MRGYLSLCRGSRLKYISFCRCIMTKKFICQSLPEAGFVRRLMAMLYDLFLVLSIWILIIGIAVIINGGEAIHSPLLSAALFGATFSFFAKFWTMSGQTLGMQTWRIRVQTYDNKTISLAQALLRFLIAICSLCCFGLGYLWMLISTDKSTWHDKLSRSRVVLLPRTSD